MIKVIYNYKHSGTMEHEQILERKRYKTVVKQAEKYNDDIDNDIYISSVSNLTSQPTHTTGFIFKVKPSLPRVRMPNRYNILGGNAFTCDYLVPWEDK